MDDTLNEFSKVKQNLAKSKITMVTDKVDEEKIINNVLDTY